MAAASCRSTKRLVLTTMTLAFGLTVSALAQPVRLMSPLEKLESTQGPAIVERTGRVVVVTLPGSDGHERLFRVEADSGSPLPRSFRSESATVLFWMGHLVLMAEDQAWHFSVPGNDAFLSDAAQVPDGAELLALTRGYDLKDVRASAISSASGPRAGRLRQGGPRQMFENDIDNQDPGGGVGSCGKTCSITCGDGSSCSTSCGGTRCASCFCPASCSCG